jgi:hypothetical protein
MTPKLSSYWLYFITSTSFSLASNLVNSMKVEVVARKNNLAEHLGISLTPYRTAVSEALRVIEQDEVGQRGAKKLEESCSNAFVIPAHMYEGLKDPNDLYLKDRESFDILVEYIKSIDRRMRKRA